MMLFLSFLMVLLMMYLIVSLFLYFFILFYFFICFYLLKKLFALKNLLSVVRPVVQPVVRLRKARRSPSSSPWVWYKPKEANAQTTSYSFIIYRLSFSYLLVFFLPLVFYWFWPKELPSLFPKNKSKKTKPELKNHKQILRERRSKQAGKARKNYFHTYSHTQATYECV